MEIKYFQTTHTIFMKGFIYLLLFVLVSTAFLQSYSKNLKEITPPVSYSIYKGKLSLLPVILPSAQQSIQLQRTG